MSGVASRVRQLRAAGLDLRLDGGKLLVEPKELISADMHAWLFRHGKEVAQLLAAEVDAGSSQQPEPTAHSPPGVRLLPLDAVPPARVKRPPAPLAGTARAPKPPGSTPSGEPITIAEASGPPDHYFKVPNLVLDRLIAEGELQASTALVLICLCRQVYGWNRAVAGATVSVRQLAHDLRLSNTTVLKALRDLERLQWIRRSGTHGGKARKEEPFRETSTIWLTLPQE